MFYVISQQGRRIIDIVSERPTLDELKTLAEEVHLDLYVIEGERIGLEYERPRLEFSSIRCYVADADGENERLVGEWKAGR